MKRLNLRLSSTQAAVGLAGGLSGVICLLLLAYCVFHGFQRKHMVVPYNVREGLGQFRHYAVLCLTAVSVLVGITAGILGYSTIGHRRNNRQTHSWIAMFLGALTVALAPILLYAWQTLREPMILGK